MVRTTTDQRPVRDSRIGAETPIWDEEFADRWRALIADERLTEPTPAKPARKATKR